MYLDGNFYFRMNLTPPYLDVLEVHMPIRNSNCQVALSHQMTLWIGPWHFASLVSFWWDSLPFYNSSDCGSRFTSDRNTFFDPTGQNPDNDDFFLAVDGEMIHTMDKNGTLLFGLREGSRILRSMSSP
jgi:hypothetical protein